MRRLDIRRRITLWNAAGFSVVLVCFGVAVYAMLRKTHYDQLDRGLDGRVAELRNELTASTTPPDAKIKSWVTKLERQQGVKASVLNAAGATVARSQNLPGAASLFEPTTRRERHESLVLPELGHVRRYTTQVDAAGQAYVIVLYKDLAHVDEEMGQVVTALAIAAPIAVGLAAALAYLLARKALAPVERLRKTTDEITAHNLHRRLATTNPDDEIGLLAGTINAMIARLERSFGEMQRFTADASHELRTPIAVVRSEAEMGLEARTPDEAQMRFASILEECQRLTWMTDQLLTLAREDAGIEVAPNETVDLAALAREVADTMQPFAGTKEQQLAVHGDEPAVVSAGAERLRQVLRNLLANAVKYTSAGGNIDVSVRRRNGDVLLTVRDTGIGIASEHLPFVFDRFYRVDQGRSEHDGGAGLGLSIVRSIVVAHGGRVDVESTPEKGSIFSVVLPASRAGIDNVGLRPENDAMTDETKN